MTYVVNKRFKGKCICGDVNLPYGTKCNVLNGCIVYNGKMICYVTSQNAYDYFSRDDDGKGLERGNLIHTITKLLEKQDKKYQDRWDEIWNDEEKLGKFRRKEHKDHWIWNFDFYNAEIKDLNYILNKIKSI